MCEGTLPIEIWRVIGREPFAGGDEAVSSVDGTIRKQVVFAISLSVADAPIIINSFNSKVFFRNTIGVDWLFGRNNRSKDHSFSAVIATSKVSHTPISIHVQVVVFGIAQDIVGVIMGPRLVSTREGSIRRHEHQNTILLDRPLLLDASFLVLAVGSDLVRAVCTESRIGSIRIKDSSTSISKSAIDSRDRCGKGSVTEIEAKLGIDPTDGS